ncbi:MAG: site-specific integrase [Alphaproteobacteria bacterium GM202ARS2]|nr:site-specific integrase [Alphaproteobacteria bacterium GM202ARS2]
MDDAMRYIAPIAIYEPRQLSDDIIVDYIAQRDEAGFAEGTIRTDLTYLSAALNYAVSKEWILSRPPIHRPPPGERRGAYIDRKDAPRFLAACRPEHVRLYAILALATAARPSHILELTWDRVDFAQRQIDFRDPLRPKTRKGRPIVPINDMALDALKLFEPMAETDYVIEHYGKPLGSMWWSIKQAGKRAELGFELYPYCLRHTAAVWMAEDNVPLEAIAQYLGHTSTKITYEYYARYSPTYLQKAAASLNVEPVRAIAAE